MAARAAESSHLKPQVRGRERDCLRVSIAVKRHHDYSSCYKGKHLGLAHNFRGVVHYCHGRNHGSMQADVVLEKELRVL